SEQLWTQNISGTSGTVIKNGPNTVDVSAAAIIDGNVIVNAGQFTVIGPGGTSVVPRLGRGGSITVNNGGTLLAQSGNALGLGTQNLPPTFLLNTGGTIKADSG